MRVFSSLFLLAALCIPVTAQENPGALLEKQRESIAAGDDAENHNDHSTAVRHYTEAVALSRRLPEKSHWQNLDQALKKLTNTLELIRDAKSTAVLAQHEALFKERVALLTRHQDDPGLALGLALLDQEAYYGARLQIEKAAAAADSALEFYKAYATRHSDCATCDLRIADVEGILGCVYFKGGQFAAAEPWLRRVSARKDDAVRPQVLAMSLRAYAAILAQRGEIAAAQALVTRSAALPIE